MIPSSQPVNESSAASYNFEVREREFTGNQRAIPIAGLFDGQSGTVSAIGDYVDIPENGKSIITSDEGDINFISIPENGKHIITSDEGDINFTSIPEDTLNFVITDNGNLEFSSVPGSGKFIVTVQDGRIEFVQAPSGPLKLLNNDLAWTDTEDCN